MISVISLHERNVILFVYFDLIDVIFSDGCYLNVHSITLKIKMKSNN